MGFNIGDVLTGGASAAVGAGMGLLLEGHNDQRQINQQQKLTDIQSRAQMNLTEYNRQQQEQLWKDTSYPAQMALMKEAGINPGLMYGSAGSGGSTNVSTGSVSSGNAQQNPGEVQQGMGLTMQAMQMALLKAQKDNIEADTQDKLANLPNKGQDVITKDLANKWESWKQSHNEEGYRVKDGAAYDKDGNIVPEQNAKTWKESENKMQYDKTFNEIDGIIKQNAVTAENLNAVKAQIAEIGQKIELMGKQGANIQEATNNLNKEGKIKDFEIEMNKIGLTHSSISDILKLLLHKLL